MVKKVISGGQSGVDRTGLEVAKALGIPTGGTAPKGYRVDGGNDPSLGKDFGLVESPYPTYPPRTEANVRDSDGTVLFGNMDSPGCKLTIKLCDKLEKPFLCNPLASELLEWLEDYGVEVLNVAGNRMRTNPGAAKQAQQVLKEALSDPNIFEKAL